MVRIRKPGILALIVSLFIAFLPHNADASEPMSAKSAILMEQKTGRVLYEKDAHKISRIASITKIMTAILAIESGKMDRYVKVSESAAGTEGSSIYLKPGEKIKLRDLVYGLMLRSGNDAAAAIAEYVGGSLDGFAFLMNQKAREIGMENTHFSNPHGLDDHENHYSTAYDMALLTRYAMQNPEYQKISSAKSHRAPNPGEQWDRVWKNKNRLLSKYEYCTGGKTGYTKRAKRTLVTTAKKGDMQLIAVTLNAPDDWNDHISMFETGFGNYDMAEVLSKGTIEPEGNPYKKERLFLKKSVVYPAKENEMNLFEVKYKIEKIKLGKSKQPKVAGKAIVFFDGKEVKQVPIYLGKKPKEKKTSFLSSLKEMLFSFTGVNANG